MLATGYVRVSTEAQGADGLGSEAQRAALHAACASKGWTLMRTEQDVASAKNLDRPALHRALDYVRAERGALVVSRLDRLVRSVGDFAGLLDEAQREGWTMLVLDPMVDLSTPYGRALAQMAAVFAQLERELIGQRTREAIAASKAAGTYRNRPPEVDDATAALIVEMRGRRENGRPWSHLRIARELNGLGLPAPRGIAWPESTVRKVLARAAA